MSSSLSSSEPSLSKTFKVVYNDCYGGFDLSDRGLAEYNRRSSKSITIPDCIDREDFFLIEMVETMDEKDINSEDSKLKVKEFDIKFTCFLRWSEYDGKETVSIDLPAYVVENVKLIIRDKHTSSDEKIDQITRLYDEIIDMSMDMK
jgi:hypothetical protein